jgi:hypothetical protein
MIEIGEILATIRPNGGWTINNQDFNSLAYDETCTPITKKEFDDAVKNYAATKAAGEAQKATAKAALLEKLGITEDEARLLLG